MLKLKLQHTRTCFSEEKKLECNDTDKGRILLSICFFPFYFVNDETVRCSIVLDTRWDLAVFVGK